MDPKEMRKTGLKISVCMGITVSFFLSLTGTLTSGHFTVIGWLLSFVVSTVISILIGFVVPMHKVTTAATSSLGLQPGKISTRCVESLISNTIYTPLMTFIMVFMAYKMAKSQAPDAPISLIHMFLGSLWICYIVGFVVIFIVQPIIMNIFIKKPTGPIDGRNGME